jgi:hypothetical protein
MRVPNVGWEAEARKQVFFFEKKNQKTFVCWAPRKLKQIRVWW